MSTLFADALVEERDNGVGSQRLFRFDNGYGASVVCGPYSYGGPSGLFELAVIRWEGNGYGLVYDTPVTNDVLGWLSTADVDNTLSQIAALPKPTEATS